MERPEIAPLGDAAVLVVIGTAADQPTVERVWSACVAIRAALERDVLDIVPAYGSVLVRFDPDQVSMAIIIACIRGALEGDSNVQRFCGRAYQVGVCFAQEFGLDLATVANEIKLSAEELIKEFCEATYSVAFVGYTAGFPYLLGLPQRLMVNRLPTPRTQVPAGSVAIAMGQCGIYPRATPGGWKILGRTAAPIFDPELDEPACFRPGDTVRFFPAARLD
ncbi:MAG: 5-oxoprolinase subunit PxpB, partial [Candidatus Eremiobacteraeota bacterium]|nr:5-oxoprolinase subunit PxpB [Candidatus Eremiobacteraeota bacterium]